MIELFQFEKNIELATVNFLTTNLINATQGRNLENISKDTTEVIFEYGGALDEPRQVRNGLLEYNAHEGTLSLLICTTREEGKNHNENIGKVRQLLLNSDNGLTGPGYSFLDLRPLGSVTTEEEENNQDTTVLQYTLKFLIDFKLPGKPANIEIETTPMAPALIEVL